MMLGQLKRIPGGRGKGEVADLYGMEVLRVRVPEGGLLADRGLARAGRRLRRAGVYRTLLPRDFGSWDALERAGLAPVDPGPLLRRCGPALALEALRRRDLDPARATVVLSGNRAGGELLRAAATLSPLVRRLVIAAPGGEALARRLRREFGIPVLPPGEQAQVELRFHPAGQGQGERKLELYGLTPALDGILPVLPSLAREDRGDLPLLCALWERGKLAPECLKFDESPLTQ